MRRAWRIITEPVDRRPIAEWAADSFILTPPLTRIGRCDLTGSRHFLAPLIAMRENAVREVSVRAPVRSAKTMLGEIWIGNLIANDPGPAMWVTGKAPLADQEWDTRMERMFLESPKMAARMPTAGPQGSRRNKQTGLVECAGMDLFVHGNALLNLQQKGIKYAVHDEVWEWDPGRLDESYGRIGDYLRMGISKVLNLSQGGEDGSDWDRVYSQGSCEEWEVACCGCGQYFRPSWSHTTDSGELRGMRWDVYKDEAGFWVPESCLASVRYECPHCGHRHYDSADTKGKWNGSGRYVATNADARPEKKSFHWTAVIDFPWRELVDMYLQAINAWKQGNCLPLIQFFQKRMAENKSERSLMEGVLNFPRAQYEVADKWDQEDFRFLTADVQETVFWVTVRAWSKRANGMSRRLYFGKAYSFDEIEALRVQFHVPPSCVGVDSGHKAKGDNGVYAACCRYQWLALKGEQERTYRLMFKQGGREVVVEKSYSSPTIADPESTRPGARRYCNLIRFSSETMADRVDGLISKGLWIEPSGGDEKTETEYKRQMSDEVKTRLEDAKTHRTYFRRVCRTKNNHAYDCAKMQVFFATATGVLKDI